MSQRERWIVYPLLFFSFLLANKDHWPSMETKSNFNVVRCKQLIIEDSQNQPAIDLRAQRAGSSEGSGVVVVYGGTPAVGTAKPAAVRLYVSNQSGATQGMGTVETYGPLGSRATQLVSDSSGGTFIMYTPDGRRKPTLRLTRNRSEDPRQAQPRPPVVPEPTDAEAE